MNLSEWAESYAILAECGDENYRFITHDEIQICAGSGEGFSSLTKGAGARLEELGWSDDMAGGFIHPL